LAGGGRTAVNLFQVGWGEGLNEAAAYLNSLPQVESTEVTAWYSTTFEPYYRGQAIYKLEDEKISRSSKPGLAADYVIFYINQVQRQLPSEGALAYFRSQPPVYTVTLNGIDYAWIYPSVGLDHVLAGEVRLVGQAELLGYNLANEAGQAFLLVTIDSSGYFWELGGSGPGIREVRQRIAQATAGTAGLSPEQILITVSHSHASPDLMGFWQPFHTPIPADFLEWHAARVVEAAVAATAAPVAAQIFQGATALVGYAGRDSGCSTVLDDTVGILQVRDSTGAPIATVVTYAKHPTILPEANRLASADFIWGYRAEVEAATGAPAMFVLGFEAAVHDGPKVAEIQASDDFERAYQVGKALADVTLAALPTLEEGDDPAILHREAIVPCPVEGSIVVQVYEMLGLPFRTLTKEGEAYVASEVPVTWHKVGPVEFVTFPGEGTPEYGLRLRQHVVSPLAFIVAQGNDAIGYFIDPESAAADPSGQLADYELRMGPGPRGGPTVWAAHAALGWFDGAWQGP